MLSFATKELLSEEKNTHMTHIEDQVIYGGVDGTIEFGNNFTMSGNRIDALGDPQSADQAANKRYVDGVDSDLRAQITDLQAQIDALTP